MSSQGFAEGTGWLPKIGMFVFLVPLLWKRWQQIPGRQLCFCMCLCPSLCIFLSCGVCVCVCVSVFLLIYSFAVSGYCPWTKQNLAGCSHELSHLPLVSREVISLDKVLSSSSGTVSDSPCMRQHVTWAACIGLRRRQNCHAVRTS